MVKSLVLDKTLLMDRGGDKDRVAESQGSDGLYGDDGNGSIYGSGNDLLLGDLPGNEDMAGWPGLANNGGNGMSVSNVQPPGEDTLTAFADWADARDVESDDMLNGGAGDDIALFGGIGGDTALFDENDLVVDGGAGIDFLISSGSNSAIEALLGRSDGTAPMDIEVAIDSDLDLASMNDLADKLNISISDGRIDESQLTQDLGWTRGGTMPDVDGVEYTYYTHRTGDEIDATMIVKTIEYNNG